MKTLKIELELDEKTVENLKNALNKYYGGVSLEDWMKATILQKIEDGSLFESC